MTGRDSIRAALSGEGARDIAAVMCYPGIFIRDHWSQCTAAPWWHIHITDIDQQIAWRSEFLEHTGCDWIEVEPFYSADDLQYITLDVRADGVYRIDARSDQAERLAPPCVSGWAEGSIPVSVHPHELALSIDAIDAQIHLVPKSDRDDAATSGRDALAHAVATRFPDHYRLANVSSPLWRTYNLWGFEGMMQMIATQPELVQYACERCLQDELQWIAQAQWLGADGIWIEDCLTDMIHPRDYAQFNLPYLRRITEAIRSGGMQSIHYYCGNPAGKYHLLMDTGADGLALEEGKKGFQIDIEEVVERANGRCAVLGNLDAIGVLEQASDEVLQHEIAHQVAIGKRNRSSQGSRFIMSTGSPVTPRTPIERVRRYSDIAHMEGHAQ